MTCEPCTYSPESVEDYSQTSSSDTRQLSLLSGMDMPAKSSANEQQKDGSPICECGKGTSECSIHPNTPEKWIASMQDSLAKTLALLESRQAYLREPDQVFTEKSCVLLTKYDPNISSWKTLQQSFLTDSEPFSETWPSWGMTQGGVAFVHPMSELRITGIVGGYSQDEDSIASVQNVKGMEMDAISAETVYQSGATRKMLWPTPTSSKGGSWRSDGQIQAIAANAANYQEYLILTNGSSTKKRQKYWPTPSASDCMDRGNLSMPSIQRRQEIGKQLNLSMGVSETSGALNPDWVGWLMGFPIGWANCKATETRKSRSKRQSLGNSLEANDD